MPINQYSVLVGYPRSGRLSGPQGKPPHYLIPVVAGQATYEVAVNVESDVGNSQVLYNIQTEFQPPNRSELTALPPGMNLLPVKTDPARDFLRSRLNSQRLVTLASMQLLPLPSQQSSGNLQNAVVTLLNQTTADPNGLIYAFGAQYSDGTGIHDIHMNQGNPRVGGHLQDNGIWQDGALMFQMPGSGQWAAVFIAFQGQSWNTDENGDPLPPA